MMSTILALKVTPGEPVQRGNDHYWRVMRALTEADRERPFDLADVLGFCIRGDRKSLRDFLRRLEKAQIVAGPFENTEGGLYWRLIKRPMLLPHLDGDGRPLTSGQDAMWNAIRALGSFDADELALAASTEICAIAVITAASYLRRLNDAGYLKIERPSMAGRSPRKTIYRLKPSMNTGPLAPKILRTKLVYDPNRNAVMGPVVAEEDR